jgi:hypothetical protein
MTLLPPFARRRSTAKLALQSLEDRTTPATALYTALSQTLTVTAAEGDQVVVSSLAGQPTGYIKVIETQASATVFDSTTAGQAVRNLVVKYGNVQSGTFTLDATAKIGGSLTIGGAMASQTVSVAGTVGGSVTYTANKQAAFDIINIEPSAVVGQNLALIIGNGNNAVYLKGGVVHGNLSVIGGTGDDQVEFTELGDVTIDGSATINLGGGNNTVLGRGPGAIAYTIHVGGNFTYSGGSGNNTFDLDISGTALNVDGNARFSSGSPTTFDANSYKFEALRVGGNITFVGGIGNDNVMADGAFVAGGNVSLNLGAGNNEFDSNLEGTGTNSIGGNLTYIGGSNGDLVSLDAMTVGKNANVQLGDSGGASQALSIGLKSPAGVTIYGSLNVNDRAGASGITLHRTFIGNALNVNAGSGDNTVDLEDVSVAGATFLNLKAGNNLVMLEMLTSDGGGALSNPTTFGGTFTVKAGAGTTTVNLSNDGDATTYVKFGSRVALQGGTGVATVNNAAENVFLAPFNLDTFTVTNGPAIK